MNSEKLVLLDHVQDTVLPGSTDGVQDSQYHIYYHYTPPFLILLLLFPIRFPRGLSLYSFTLSNVFPDAQIPLLLLQFLLNLSGSLVQSQNFSVP